MHPTRISTAALCATLSLASAGPAAAGAQTQDLRTPDTQDIAPHTDDIMPWQDLRTPDAQDAAFDATHPDHANSQSTGFDIGDATVGAAATLGLILTATGTSILIARRRPAPHTIGS
jgi:hypothetical protein